MKKVIKWVVVAAIVLAAGYFLYDRFMKPKEAAVIEEPMPPIIFPVTQETVTKYVQVKGKSKYVHETLVYAPFASKVTRWNVENGSQVKKGDMLFTLDTDTLKNEIDKQEATIHKDKLEAELNAFVRQQEGEAAAVGATEAERLKSLASQETGRIGEELNKVNEEIQVREIADKKSKIQTASYRASSSGIFLLDNSTSSERPQIVTDNQYIGKIVDLKQLEFIALVGEQDIFQIKPGMKVQVQMSALKGVVLTGEVKKVAKFATTASGKDNTLAQSPQFEVVISLQPDKRLIGGLSLTGKIVVLSKGKATVIPSLAVIHEGDLSYVMLDAGNGQYKKTKIEVGLETSDKVEILSGIKPGDTISLP